MGTDVFLLGDDQSYAASMANDYTLKPSSEMSDRASSRAHIQEVAAEVLSKENGTGKVFSIYGTGGLGKTFLMEELYSDFTHRFTSASFSLPAFFLAELRSSFLIRAISFRISTASSRL